MGALASRGVSLIPLRVIATIGVEDKAGENKILRDQLMRKKLANCWKKRF